MNRIKVAHITTVDDSLHGLLLNQMRSLRRAGYDVIGISAPGQFVPQIEAAGVRHIPLQMTRTITPGADLVALGRLARVLRHERVTIVHTHTPKAGLIGQLAARIARVPVVLNTIHGFYFHEHMPRRTQRFYIAMERLAARCSDRILSQNHEDLQTALRLQICRPDQIKYLGNGIDLRQFDPERVPEVELARWRDTLHLTPETRVVGFVGRLAARRKGFEDFLIAARALAARVPEIRFVVVGAPDRGKADAIGPEAAERFGIADRIHFLGHRPNEELPALYMLMDVLVLPSLFEGIPRVIMEAAAMGIPAVASNVKGNREAVVPGQNGALVRFGDTGALARAVEELITDAERRRAMREAARRLAHERFDERRVFGMVQQEYSSLLGAAGIFAHPSAAHAD
jgi:glycosyltransferase involved in cell wall biosynthesis